MVFVPLSLRAQETRVIPLGVHNPEGKFIGGLRADQIEVRGLEADWKLAYDDGPRRVVILLDLSGSMGQDKKWERAKAFVTELSGVVSGGDEVALHAFAEQHEVIVSLTREQHALADALASLPRPGSRESRVRFGYSTHLKPSLLASTREPLGFGGVLVLVTDQSGGDTSRVAAKSVSSELVRQGVRVVHVNVEEPPSALVLYGTSELDGIVEATGGHRFSFWHSPVQTITRRVFYSASEPRDVAHAVYGFINHTYRLELVLGRGLTKKRKLQIRVSDKQVRKQLFPQLEYPEMIYPAKESTE